MVHGTVSSSGCGSSKIEIKFLLWNTDWRSVLNVTGILEIGSSCFSYLPTIPLCRLIGTILKLLHFPLCFLQTLDLVLLMYPFHERWCRCGSLYHAPNDVCKFPAVKRSLRRIRCHIPQSFSLGFCCCGQCKYEFAISVPLNSSGMICLPSPVAILLMNHILQYSRHQLNAWSSALDQSSAMATIRALSLTHFFCMCGLVGRTVDRSNSWRKLWRKKQSTSS